MRSLSAAFNKVKVLRTGYYITWKEFIVKMSDVLFQMWDTLSRFRQILEQKFRMLFLK